MGYFLKNCMLYLFSENHTTLLVMEYVENGCLRDYLAEKSKSIKKSTEGNTGAKLAAFKKQLPELHRFNYEISQVRK